MRHIIRAAGVAAVVPGVLLFDSAIGRLQWRRTEPYIEQIGTGSGDRIGIIVPGFSIPPGVFAKGMLSVIEPWVSKAFIVYPPLRGYDTAAIVRLISETYNKEANITDRPPYDGTSWPPLLLFGHSMGGQACVEAVAMHLPVSDMVLDCTPTDATTIHFVPWLQFIARSVFRYYRGGPLGMSLVALIMWVQRALTPTPRSSKTSNERYRRFEHGLRWYPNSAWIAQLEQLMRYHLPEKLPFEPRTLLIGGSQPLLDPLVRQKEAIEALQQILPNAHVATHHKVIHANPLEQPEVYGELLARFMNA